MVFGRVFNVGMNIDTPYSWCQRDLADDRAVSHLGAALITSCCTGFRQRPGATYTQDRAYRSRTKQFDFWWRLGFANKQIVLRRTIVVQIANVPTIHKAVQASEDGVGLLVKNCQCPIFLVGFD